MWMKRMLPGMALLAAGLPGAALGQVKPSGQAAPAAIITCGGEPTPAPIECKTWKCTSNVWTLANKTNGSACTDGNPCTNSDKCTGGRCGGTAALPGQACSDSNACTVGDVCDAAKHCIAGPAATIDDGNPCTADSCDPVEGVTHYAVTTACCTGGLVQPGKSCGDGFGACSAAAACIVTSNATRYCYDKAGNVTGRLSLNQGQECATCP